MRPLLIAPIALILTAAIGYALCKLAGFDPHVRSMLRAGVIALLACAAGAAPLVLSRRASQPAMAQAGLLATTAHLFASAGLSLVALMVMHAGLSFVYWILAFYWTTLIGIVIASVRAVNSAPVDRSPAPADVTPVTAGATAGPKQ